MNHIELVCDATEVYGIWGAEIPDVLVITGHAMSRINSQALALKVRALKENIATHPQAPIKWNMKDIKRACELHGLGHLQESILFKSEELRDALLGALCELEPKVFVSAILAYSNKKQVLGKTREELVGYSFANLLMRTGLYKSELNNSDEVELMLDWPDGGKREPFIREYCSAWKRGESYGSKAIYTCGPLSNHAFRSAPVFGITDLDERLQVADVVTGASKSFVNFCLDKVEEDDFGVRMFQRLCPHLYRDPAGRSFGRGLTVSPTNSTFSAKILDGLKKLGC